jgi:hypothetical protein
VRARLKGCSSASSTASSVDAARLADRTSQVPGRRVFG